jgi:hypothetical protein
LHGKNSRVTLRTCMVWPTIKMALLIYHKDGMKEYRMHLVQSNKIVNFKIMKL